MDNIKERAELADICYTTVSRECAKPISDINTELVKACIELAELLLGIQPLSDTELAKAKQKLSAMTRRRKSLRIRILAAVVAALILLGTTVYAFSDWIIDVFGIETIQRIHSGDKVTVGDNVLDAAETNIEFYNVDELYEFFGDSVMLPSEESNVEFIDARYNTYEEYDILLTTWRIDSIPVDYIITINDKSLNQNNFDLQEYEYYSQNGQLYDIIELETGWQAATVTDKTQYTVFCTDKETLTEFINIIA